MKLLFATRNRGKLAELRQLTAELQLEVLSLDDVEVPEVDETGTTFAENAELKARAVCKATGLPCLADDSGLEVDALDGQPGVHSARYAGPGASDRDRIDKLLRALQDLPDQRRTARFRCVIAYVVTPDAPAVFAKGSVEGRILHAPSGDGGFGYDPVFYVETLGCTFAEARPEQKNQLSHRGIAMREMAKLLSAS
jgi:XTP/dITP diphosphohydrolase